MKEVAAMLKAIHAQEGVELSYLLVQYICFYAGLGTGSLKIIFKHKTLSFLAY
jgi:hypothetical protein